MDAERGGLPPYPVNVDLEAPLEITWWRAVGNPILAIPHMIILSALSEVIEAVWCITFFAILFTGSIPKGLFDFNVMIFRYYWRVATYVFFMRESYPPFDFTPRESDPGGDPAELSIEYPAKLSRVLIFFKWFVLIPHFVILALVSIVAVVMLILGWFSVLFSGQWPKETRSFVLGTMRWAMRVTAYFYLLTDQYPPFGLQS